MAMSNMYGELSKAAGRLEEGRDAAYQAKDVMDASGDMLQKQKDFKTTAQEQALRAQTAIIEAQERLKILAETLDKGNEGGWKLHEHVAPAMTFLQTADEKMNAATDHVLAASPSGQFKGANLLDHITSNYRDLSDARRGVEAVDDAGQRSVADFSAATRSTEQLSSIMGLAGDQITSLIGQIAAIGDKKVTNPGAIEPQNGAVAVENFAGALRYTTNIAKNLADPNFQ
jgi:hypothetical protein